ncbi:hypothetical protein ACER0C_003180 [Sarotherodon galilaeus]
MRISPVSQHASGVEVYEGVESVLLPCQVPADVSRSSTSAVWDREEFRNPTVHLRLQSNDDLSGQNERYTNRTSMFGDRLSQTEVQLKVTEPPPVWPKVLSAVLVTLIILAAAFGLFVCRAYVRMKKRSEALQQEVVEAPQGEESVLLPFKPTADLPQDVTVEWTHNNMKVHVYESGNNQPDKQDQGYRGRTEMKEDPLRTKDLSLTLKHLHLTDSGVYTCTIKKDGHMLLQKSVALSVTVPQPEKMEVAGVRTVQLPFKTTADLPQDVTVEWRHSDYNYMKVHVNERGKNKPDKQDQGYRALQKKVLEVTEGDESVLLAFKFPADLPQDVTVEWTHNYRKVHVYESGNNQPDKQSQSYNGFTEMDEDPLRTKDLSLTLKYPYFTDSGVYTCTVYNKDGHMLLQKSVTLYFKDAEMQMVVTQGLKFVMLPFKIPHDLPHDVTVEWKHNYVTVYKYIDVNVDSQHQDYRGRTEMNKDALKTKDLSLTLKDLHLTDSGVYTCTVYKDGDMLTQKVVTLSVRALEPKIVKVTEGEESVLLVFKTTADLPQDVTVEWTHNNMQVHVYESGNNQPDKQNQSYRGRTEMKKDPLRTKDLSLTLKDLHLTDSGVYTCTVYNKDGHMLLQKVVTLSVRGSGVYSEHSLIRNTEPSRPRLFRHSTLAPVVPGLTFPFKWTLCEILSTSNYLVQLGPDLFLLSPFRQTHFSGTACSCLHEGQV